MSNFEYEEFITSTLGHKTVHKCKYCPYFSESIFFMKNHVRRHRSCKEIFNCEKNQLEMFYCRKCEFNTEIFMLLRRHLLEVHASDKRSTLYILKNYICKKCSFQTYSRLHWLRHSTNNNCGNGNSDNNGYCKFLQTVNQFTCNQCPYKAKRSHHLKVHKIRKHSSEEDINWFKCVQCSYKSKQNYELKMHKIRKHTSGEDINWFKCDHCSYKSKRKDHLKNHKIGKHTSEKAINWFKCDQCPHKTKRKDHLKAHKIRIHTVKEDI